MSDMRDIPYRQIRALHNESTVRVYQAYSPAIAEPALKAGTFVPPFKRERMTWIKPSFLWMAYRCGWASKPGQERVLALDLTQEGFAWALGHSALSHYDPDFHPDRETWAAEVKTTPVRIQWDPERGLHHQPLPHRSIQIGLRGEAVGRYVDDWITAITDVTATMKEIGALVADRQLDRARALLPDERPYTGMLPDSFSASAK